MVLGDRIVPDSGGISPLAFSALMTVLLNSASGQCALEWERFPGGQLGSASHAWRNSPVLVADESGTRELYAGGTFDWAGRAAIHNVARWDGHEWSALGGGVDSRVEALTFFDEDGAGPNPSQLFVGGQFTTAGGTEAFRIAKWDGVNWSALGRGMNRDVIAMTVFDDDGPGPNPEALYAAGNFTVAGSVTANRVAKWDGSSWSSLGAGLNDEVYSLAVFDEDGSGPIPAALFATGKFTFADGVLVRRIARWNGSAWSAIGSGEVGLNAEGLALAVFDEDGAGPGLPALFAGGNFTQAGSVLANGVARWDGLSWSPLSVGVASSGGFDSARPTVLDMHVLDDDGPGPQSEALYVAGYLTSAGGAPAVRVARWDGVAWSALGFGPTQPDTTGNVHVRSLAAFDDDGPGPNPSRLYAAGYFKFGQSLSGTVLMSVAKWDTTSWSWPGFGITGGLFAFEVFDDDGPGPHESALYAGGGFLFAGSAFMERIAKWDGSDWSPLGSGVQGAGGKVSALEEFDSDGPGPNLPQLVAGGRFQSAGGLPANCIARWNGSTWSSLGSGIDSEVYCLATFDPDGLGPLPLALYAGGSFTLAGGQPALRTAKWDGSAWNALGTGADDLVFAMTVFDDDGPGLNREALYIGGWFQQVDGVNANRVARFDGTTWSPVGGGLNYHVQALAVFDDDGAGPRPQALYAGGHFTQTGGQSAFRIARWDGATWSEVGGGLNDVVHALTVFDDDGPGPRPEALYAAGGFSTAGNIPALNIARWDGTAWSAVLGGQTGPGYVLTLKPFDTDGAGPTPSTLYMGGVFYGVDGLPSCDIAGLQSCGPLVTTFCSGDGSGTSCPCGYGGAPGNGCPNSQNALGANISSYGWPSIGADTFVLWGSGMPDTSCLYLQGTNQVNGGSGVCWRNVPSVIYNC